MTFKPPFKRFLVALAMILALIAVALLIPAFLQDLHGTYHCNVLGSLAFCWSIK